MSSITTEAGTSGQRSALFGELSSGGPNIISTGHHQRLNASCAICFCSAVPRHKACMMEKPWRK